MELQQYINDYVDLGLPSGTLWAKCNLGAEHEYDFGKYYQWGDIVGCDFEMARIHSIWATTPFNGGKSVYDGSEFASVSGDVCPNSVLAKEYDAVYQATNGKAHMPTKEQLEELYNYTTNEWTTVNGVNGRKFTSNTNGNSIFVPASGFVRRGLFMYVGYYGLVWTSSLYSSYPYNAYNMLFDSEYAYPNHYLTRYLSFPIRGVISKN